MWLERNGEWIERDTQEPWVTKGYTVKTDQERSDYLAAQQAAADEAATAAALEALIPAQFPTGVAVQDENDPTHWHKLAVVADEVVPVQISNSPVDPAAWKAIYDAKLAERKAELTAQSAALTELNLTAQQITAIKNYFDADIDQLFSTLTANQRNCLKVQRALVKALTKQAVKEVR